MTPSVGDRIEARGKQWIVIGHLHKSGIDHILAQPILKTNNRPSPQLTRGIRHDEVTSVCSQHEHKPER